MYLGRRPKVIIGSAIGLGTATLAVAFALRGRALVHSGPAPIPIWAWLERLSWLAGLGSLLIGLVTLWIFRRDPTGDPRTEVLPASAGTNPGAFSIHPPRRSSELPIRGRASLLDELTSFLRRGGSDQSVRVLHGLGGSGKTTIALALAELAQQRRYEVWWVSGATPTELSSGMRQVAVRLGAGSMELERAWSGLDSATDLLWRLLDRHAMPWMLVIDNADEPDWLGGPDAPLSAGTAWLRPVRNPRGRLLITTRDGNPRVWGPWCHLHRVDPLPAADAAAVLTDHVGSEAGDEADAARLAERVGGLPLALRLAGAYLADAKATPWPGAVATFRDYASALDRGEFGDLLADDSALTAADQGRRTIMRTWDVSLDLLDRRGLGDARALLTLLSFLADAPVPYHLVLHPPTLATHPMFAGSGLERIRTLVRSLGYLGLVVVSNAEALASRSAGFPVLDIHPLVREVSRRKAAASGDAHSYLALIARLFRRIADAEDVEGAENPAHWPLWESITPHILHVVALVPENADLSTDAVEDLAYAGRLSCAYLFSSGQLQLSADAGCAVLAACSSRLGDRNTSLLAVRHNLASIALARGDVGTARKEYSAVLATRKEVLGDDHPQTLTTRHQIAYLLADTGKYEQAERECRAVVDAYHHQFGPEHYRVVIGRQLLTRILFETGRLDEAEVEILALEDLTRRTLGGDHPRTLSAQRWHGSLLLARGQGAASEQLLRTAIEVQLRVLGPEHRDYLQSRHLLGRALTAQDRLSDAVIELEATEAAVQRVYGADHPYTSTVQHDLSKARQGKGGLPEQRQSTQDQEDSGRRSRPLSPYD